MTFETKAVFHDEKREIGSSKLIDILKYQSEIHFDVLPSWVGRNLRVVKLQKTNEAGYPSKI